jgi:hypothetical protein
MSSSHVYLSGCSTVGPCATAFGAPTLATSKSPAVNENVLRVKCISPTPLKKLIDPNGMLILARKTEMTVILFDPNTTRPSEPLSRGNV